MAKGTVNFCRIEAFVDNAIRGSYSPRPLSNYIGDLVLVMDTIIDISEKPKMLKDLFDDPDITQISVSELIDPWYLTKYTHSRVFPTEIWNPDPVILPKNASFRPYGTPEEVKKIETIWESPEVCRRILRRYQR